MEIRPPPRPPVPVTGLALVSALGPDLAVFAARLLAGQGGLTGELLGWPVGRLPEGVVPDPAANDAPAALAEHVVRAAWAQAGLAPGLLGAPETILVLSSTKGDIRGLLGACRALGEVRLGALLGRVRRRLEHSGHAELVSSACASGGFALARAARLLELGWGERAVVVGLDRLDPFVVQGFASLGALSRAACRPFDTESDGLSLGEAAAALVLEPGGDAGVRLAGVGQSCDARGILAPSEDGEGWLLAARRALADAGPGALDGVCGHGTGTPANDCMEAAAVRRLAAGVSLPLFGIKGAVGHTLGCATLLDVAACVTALEAGRLPGTVGNRSPLPGLEVLPTTRPAALRRLLCVNSGFGGSNVALVLERT